MKKKKAFPEANGELMNFSVYLHFSEVSTQLVAFRDFMGKCDV